MVVVPVLAAWLPIFDVTHLLAIALGLGAATVADLFFLLFLRDFRISEAEAALLHRFTQVIWFAFGLIAMSGLAIILLAENTFWMDSLLQMESLLAGVLFFNGILLHVYLAPRILQIEFLPHPHTSGELLRARQVAFIFGPVSIVSWYWMFVISWLATAPSSFGLMWRWYLGTIVVAVLIGLLSERFITWRARRVVI